jgi:predicted transcriptional regulator YdeE
MVPHLQRQTQTAVFGPCRIIGMNYIGQDPDNNIPQLWSRFCARVSEIDKPKEGAGFGVCRCLPGGTGFEYVAAVEATQNAKVPDGMMAVDLPRCDYAVFQVPEIPEVRNVWRSSSAELDASQEWARYCGPSRCDCASHPAFEYYQPGYRGNGPFFIYLPVKPK